MRTVKATIETAQVKISNWLVLSFAPKVFDLCAKSIEKKKPEKAKKTSELANELRGLPPAVSVEDAIDLMDTMGAKCKSAKDSGKLD